MEFTLHEAVPDICSSKTELGRVVINPPSMIGPLITKPTGTFIMCCSRAFLTEESYFKHFEDKEIHDKAIDFSKLPRPPWYKEPCLDGPNFKLWYVRKHGCALKAKLEAEAKDLVEDADEKAETNRNGIVKDKRGRKKCSLCNLLVLYNNMKRHVQNCHVEDGIKCSYCPCAFLLKRSLVRHQRTVHGVRKRNNSTNKFQKTIVARAKKQLVFKKVRNGNLSFECSVCGKNLFHAVGLSDHMNSHTGARPYKCEKCGYRFSHRSNLARHKKKSHTKNDKFFCRTCKCSFSNNSLLKRHYKAMHPQKLKIKRLNSPERKLQKRDTLSASPLSKKEEPSPNLLNTPTKDSSGFYECHVCHKKLTTTQTLRGHMLIHQNLKPYNCKFCGISFRLLSTVSQHIASAHSGGSFKCKQCTCRFKVLKALIRHIKVIHLELKENKKLTKSSEGTRTSKDSPKKNFAGYKCNLCGRGVKTLSEFNAHKIFHDGSNRSQCNLCLKSFGSTVNVKIHKMRAHGDDAIHVHKCTFCCCKYKASQALYSHLVKEHQMNREDWNFTQKSIKPEACHRIQMSLCDFDSNQDSNSIDSNNESKITDSDGKSEGGKDLELNEPFECDICHLRFKVRRSITKHKKIAHNHGSYVCGLCPCRYHKLRWLEKHQFKVHGRLKLPEREEKKEPLKVQKGQVTKRTIFKAKKFECNLCKLSFVTAWTRENHKKKAHFHSGKFKCSECSCKFMALKGLELHRALHHGYIGKRRQLANRIMNGHAENFENSESNSSMNNEDELLESNQSLEDDASISVSVNTKTYECDLCHIKFNQNGTLRNHKLNSHFHSGKFKCSKCSCKFMTIHGLVNHKKLHAKYQSNKAVEEKVNSAEKKREEATTQTTSPIRTSFKNKNEDSLTETVPLPVSAKFKCDLCGLMVARGLWYHKKKSHGSGSHSCSDCTCAFETPQGLTRHRVVYHNSKYETHDDETKESVHVTNESNTEPEETTTSVSKVNRNFLKIRGSFSPKKSKSKSSISQVLNSPAKETKMNGAIYPTNTPRPAISSPHYKFKCDQCGIRLTHGAYLRRHLRMAHSSGGVACDLCTCTFISGGALAAHKRVYHSPSHVRRVPRVKKLLKSVKSKLTFDRKAVFDTVVKSKKPSDRRNSASDFNSTNRSSSNENEVDKNSQSPSAKRKRSTMNSNTEPEISPETSSQTHEESESSLEDSNLLITLPKDQHQCKLCSKAFYTPRLLTKHMLSHTKPEKCPHCSMAFRHKEEVARHIEVAHDESCIHQCFICSCRFSTETGLRRHQGIMHKDQPKINEDNIVIEEDDGAVSDSEPFLRVESAYSQQNINENGFCEESVPIVQGILEANYLPNGDVVYTNGIGDQMSYPDVPESPAYSMHQDIQEFEEEPVFHSVVEYDDSEVVYREALPSPPTYPKINPVARKKTFSPKSRPMKCSECELMCLGPENLRLHMESHNEVQEQLEEPEDLPADEESVCDPESMQVDDSAKDFYKIKMINCDKCSYEFGTKNELMQHLESEHDESGLYRCAYCPCTMKTEINLRYHFMKYHSG